MTVSKLRIAAEAFWRVFATTFAVQLVTSVQAVTNVADVAHYEWWVALAISAATAALTAGLRVVVPQPVDAKGVGVAGVSPPALP